jgi:hypothetical protein
VAGQVCHMALAGTESLAGAQHLPASKDHQGLCWRGRHWGCRGALCLQARAAYDKMREDGVEPNARFFTQLICIAGRAGDLQARAGGGA